jgi:type I restriction enzyme S subunit
VSGTKTDEQANPPPGWVYAPLEEICQINPPLDHYIGNDAVEVIFVPMRAVDPDGGGLVRPEARRYGEVKKGYTPFVSGDVIMAKITPCMENGKTTVVPDLPGSICFGSTEFHVIRPEAGVSAKWVASFLMQHEVRRAAQRSMTGGVGQMRVPARFLESVRTQVAPTAEQERIADAVDELLSDLDAGVAALERVREKLKLYRASVLKAAVEGALTAAWRKQHPHTEAAPELLKRILSERRRRWEEDQLAKFRATGQKPSENWKAKYKEPVAPDTRNLPPLPDGWCWSSLGQLSSFVTSGSRGWKEFYSNEGPIFIRSQDINTDRLEIDNAAHVCPPRNSEGMRTKVQHRDLLITITGANVAKAALVDIDLSEAYVSQHVGLIRLAEPETARFVHLFTITPSGGRKRLLAAAYGAGKPGLNLDNLKELQIPLPPDSEMATLIEAVEDQFSIIDHFEADIDTKLKTAQALRQAILRHAFTGQLVPQDPNDEPASELLKRIATERAAHTRVAAAAKRAAKMTNGPQRRRPVNQQQKEQVG